MMTKLDPCKNGDKLHDLIAKQREANSVLELAATKLRHAEATLAPLRREVEKATRERDNFSCRLNVWWNEFREANGEKKRGPNHWRVNGGILGTPLTVILALLSIAATNYFGKTDLRERPALFPTNAPPTHLAAPVEFPGLMPPVVTVTHPAAVVVPATNKPIVLPAFKYPAVPGSNQMWLIQSSTNRVWQTIASGTNNVKTVSNRVWTTLLPFCLPAAGTLDLSNKAPSAAYRVMGVQKQ